MTTALVTGASSGIGHATAKKLIEAGYTVYVAARRVEKMRDLEEQGAVPLALDITRDEDIVRAVERIVAERGSVDILVNNAGFGMYGAMEDTTLEDARYQFEVNLFGLARLTQLVLPHMREKRAGKIVNISSMGGKIYTPLGSWYHATKHALEGWSDCLRLEVAPFDIDVIIIEPGIIRTEFSEVFMGPMLERSGKGAYADMARALAKWSRDSHESGGGSPPSVVAETIMKALRARKPRTRYAVGSLAKPMILLRKWLGDRVFDKAVTSRL